MKPSQLTDFDLYDLISKERHTAQELNVVSHGYGKWL